MATIDARNYVVNELLVFETHKLQRMPPDSICQLCVSFYEYEVVENASKVQFELCGSANRADRYRRRQGERKKLETLSDIMALIQRRNNELPVTFVALDLSNLPPVSFDNIDVCVLLSRMEHMKLEVASISAWHATRQSVDRCSPAAFANISACAAALDLQLFSKTVYNRIQRRNLLPGIQEAWALNLQLFSKTVFNQIQRRNLGGRTTEGGSSGQAAGVCCVGGGGRYDTPGHNAKFGSYTPMHSDGDGHQGTRKIVSMKLVQVSEQIYDL